MSTTASILPVTLASTGSAWQQSQRQPLATQHNNTKNDAEMGQTLSSNPGRGCGYTGRVPLFLTALFVLVIVASAFATATSYAAAVKGVVGGDVAMTHGINMHLEGDGHGVIGAVDMGGPPRVRSSNVVTYRFDVERGYALEKKDTGAVHMQRVPHTGGLLGIEVADIIDVNIICTVVSATDGTLSVIRHPWTSKPPDATTNPESNQDWVAWYNVYSDKTTGGVFLVIQSYSVQDNIYSGPLQCNIAFTLA
jgi:hypothetical protein